MGASVGHVGALTSGSVPLSGPQGAPIPLHALLPAVGLALGVNPARLPDTTLPQARQLRGVLPADGDHVVVLLVDGLGELQLRAHGDLLPRLAGLGQGGPLAAPFPSTTPVSLACFGTGLAPGLHGIVGTSFRLDDGTFLAPLSWQDEPNPVATQPEPTMLEVIASAGVHVLSAGPSSHRHSGLTRAALRGGVYAGADTIPARIAIAAHHVGAARAAGRRSLTYVYWPDLDKAAHVHGVASPQYRAQLARVEDLVCRLLDHLGEDTTVLVTADHGMVDVPDAHRIDLEAHMVLRREVTTILGEPRARHVYCLEGAASRVARTWTDVLGDRARVLLREDAAALMAPVDDWNLDRIGDVVAIATADWSLVSQRVDRVLSGLRGQHGGTTPDEVLIPLRIGAGQGPGPGARSS